LRVGESNAADNHDDEQRRNDPNRDPLDVHEASMRPPCSVGFGTRVHMSAARQCVWDSGSYTCDDEGRSLRS
jgi:hypothetical protein